MPLGNTECSGLVHEGLEALSSEEGKSLSRPQQVNGRDESEDSCVTEAQF